MIRVTIFEDNNSLRNGLSQLVDGSKGYSCVGAFPDCSNLLKNIDDTKPDVVLMDIEMPGMSGIEGVKILHDKKPELKVLCYVLACCLSEDVSLQVCTHFLRSDLH